MMDLNLTVDLVNQGGLVMVNNMAFELFICCL